ncbi:phosphomethylpyrimidine synthase [soil metagenome]
MDGLGSWQEDCQFMAACAAEQVDPAVVAKAVDDGTVVFLRSRASRSVETFAPALVGTGTRAKVTALIGLGPRDRDRASIIDSMSVIVAARPDAVIDLTTNPEGIALRHELKEVMGVPLGACLTYDLFGDPRRKIGKNEFLERFEAGLAPGVDFALIHAGMDWSLIEAMKHSDRVMPTTSRGGGLVSRYMRRHECDNPLLEHLEDIAEICRRYEVVLDLGDIFRPGCIADAGDELKMQELGVIAGARERLMAAGVQVLCEAGGHMPIDKIPALISEYKRVLGGAPLWLAGPMVVDTAITLDSIVNTIGVAVAGQHGGDMFASITQNEHYAMPTAVETAEAVRNVRVAISALDVARHFPAALSRNHELSKARRLNAWSDQAELSLYPDLSRQVFLQHDLLKDGQPCTICGIYCPHVVVKKDHETPADLTVVQA